MLLFSLVVWIAQCCGAIKARSLQQTFHSPSQRLVSYAGSTVFRCHVDKSGDFVDIYHISRELNLDVWSTTHDHVDVRVPDIALTKFVDLLPEHVRKATTQMIPDLDYTIRQNLPSKSLDFLTERVPSLNDTFFSDFQSVEAINAWLNLIVILYPGYASRITLGKTHEGREIYGLKVSKPTSVLGNLKFKKRKVILVHGAQHAREWISVSTVCYLAYSLIAGHTEDVKLGYLVHDFDWVFLPTVNVDGYAYSFQDRLWRKNRQPTSVPFCKGIDLDRNWDFGWDQGQNTISSSPCSENYEGTRAFEAHETRLLSKYIKKIQADPHTKLVGYLDLHSYAQTILYPYALSCDLDVRDEESLIELGVGASKAIKASSGEHYDTESACNQDGHVLASVNSGAALDWVYDSGVRWSYVVKLRDTGSYGFLVPKEEIVPTGEEMLGFLKYFGSFIKEHS